MTSNSRVLPMVVVLQATPTPNPHPLPLTPRADLASSHPLPLTLTLTPRADLGECKGNSGRDATNIYLSPSVCECVTYQTHEPVIDQLDKYGIKENEIQSSNID